MECQLENCVQEVGGKMTVDEFLKKIEEEKIRFVDFRIVDLLGRQHHVTVPAEEVSEETFVRGVAFDGSSITGYKGIEESDMVMMPDPDSAFKDPFIQAPTLSILCDIYNPDGTPYSRDPRIIAKKAEAYLKETGIATDAFFGPEAEFFVFDEVRFSSNQMGSYYFIDSEEAFWNSGKDGGLGYKIGYKKGYFPVAPSDTQTDIRNEMVMLLEECGVPVERHHHEVATAGQGEINFRFSTLTKTADNLLLYKYIVRNVAKKYGKTATFMPKPIVGDNGNGMHVHQSLFRGDTPLFYESGNYANLSDLAFHYIGGLLTHAHSVIAFTNPSTNSYKRLVPGFEAPVNLVFSKANRSAAVRVPVASVSPKSTRIEFRTPDSTSNPYLAFAAMLLAGIDGIKKRIDARTEGFGPYDKNIYELTGPEKNEIKSVPKSLEDSLAALKSSHQFLLEGDVFNKDLIDTWLELKESEAKAVATTTHPKEYELYYDL